MYVCHNNCAGATATTTPRRAPGRYPRVIRCMVVHQLPPLLLTGWAIELTGAVFLTCEWQLVICLFIRARLKLCIRMWSGPACPKCGKYRNGKPSCCANGGSWYEKCGNPPKLYTWFQGIRACKHLASGAQMQFTSSFQTTISHEFGDGQQSKNTYSTGYVDNDTASPVECNMISHMITLISLLLICLHV